MGKQSAWSSDLVHCHWHFSPIPEPIVELGGGGEGDGIEPLSTLGEGVRASKIMTAKQRNIS